MSHTTALCALIFCLFISWSLCAVVDPSKTTVSSVTDTQANTPSFFSITPRDSSGAQIKDCSLQFNVQFNNSAANVGSLGCTQGVRNWQWNSTLATGFLLDINYDGTPVAKSPYLVKVSAGPISPAHSSASGEGIVNMGNPVGNNYYFTITAYDTWNNRNTTCPTSKNALKNTWNVTLINGENISAGTVVNCTDGIYTISYFPTLSGTYSLSVSGSQGQNLPDSPYSVSYVPGPVSAQMSTASGTGSREAVAGVVTTFYIITRDMYGNSISSCNTNIDKWAANLTSPSGKNVPADIGDCSSGVISATYTLYYAGGWSLHIWYNGVASKNISTVVVTASPDIAGQNCKAFGNGLKNGTAGSVTYFNIQAYDDWGNKIGVCAPASDNSKWSVNLFATNDQSITCSGSVNCDTKNQGNYTAHYSCNISATYDLHVAYSGDEIQKSPFLPTISPSVIDALHTVLSGDGVTEAYAGVKSYLILDAHDQYNNKITKCVSGPPGFFINIVQTSTGKNIASTYDNCTGGYYYYYYVLEVDDSYSLSVLYQGSPINGTNQPITFYPGPPDFKKCTIQGPGLLGSTAGVPGQFWLFCTDQYNNKIYSCNAPGAWSGTLYYSNVIYPINHDNCYTSGGFAHHNFSYVATNASNSYTLSLTYTNSIDSYITNPVKIVAGPFDPAHSYATGPGVSSFGNVAGNQASIQVHSSDEYGNQVLKCYPNSLLSGNAQGPQQQQYNITFSACNNGMFPASYTPTKAGHYQVYIYYDGQPIEYSPYDAGVIGGPINAGSCVLTPLNEINNLIAGQIANFTIMCYDKYNNPVSTCDVTSSWTFKYSGGNFQNGISSCQSGLYYGFYLGTKSGSYSVTVNYKNQPIKDAPIKVIISAADLSETKSTASGPGFQGNTIAAGSSTNVLIHSNDRYGNPINQCIQNYYWNVRVSTEGPFPSTSCANGTYTAVFSPTIAGTNLNVWVSGANGGNVSNNPGKITITPGQFSFADSYWYTNTTRYRSTVVGETFIFYVQSTDQYGNNVTTCLDTITKNSTVVFSYNINPNITYSVLTPLQFCTNGLYSTQSFRLAKYIGDFTVTVLVNHTARFNTPYPNFNVGTGYAVATNSIIEYAECNAGALCFFAVQLVNQYHIAVLDPDFCSTLDIGWQASVVDNDTTIHFQYPCAYGAFLFLYNTRKTGLKTVTAYGSYGTNSTYNITTLLPVMAGPLDVRTLSVTNVTSKVDTSGTFSMSAHDIFNNEDNTICKASQTTNCSLSYRLTPSCVNTTVLCSPDSTGHLSCNFTVEEGGQYCIQVSYIDYDTKLPIDLPLNNSQLVVYGGSRCGASGCNSQGFCFVTQIDSNTNSTTNTTNSTTKAPGVCHCLNGYTGDNCETSITKKYMKLGLAIGLIVGLSILLLIIGLLIGYFALGRLRRD